MSRLVSKDSLQRGFENRRLRLAMASAVVGPALLAGGPAMARDSKSEILDTAQAVVARSALACTVVDADTITPEPMAGRGGRHGGGMGGGGGGGRPGGAGSPTSQDQSRPIGYEVACKDGPGFILIHAQPRGAVRHDRADEPGDDANSPAPFDYLNCLEAKEAADRTNSPLRCRLKANKDQTGPIQALVRQKGLDCAVSRVRGLGHTETQSFFELACARAADHAPAKLSDTGYILITGRSVLSDEPAAAYSCFDTQANPQLRCDLTHVGPTVEALHRFIAKSDPGCSPAAQRLAGISTAGGRVFEIGCRNGAGYMLRMADDGTMDPPVACSAPGLADKCRLAAPASKS
jgi:hypothetical protein